LITRANDNAIVWRWDNIEPFGDSAANENPSGQGVFKYGLRLPGQYFDAETGMNYNYFRDYDSSAGRYIESDPAGLRAGPNSYIYVGAAAADHADPQGLIKWVGDLRSWGTLDVFRDELTLKSECACGLRYYATVRAVGFTLGWGSSADAWSAVELEDRLDCPNPDVFDGPYLKIGLGVAGPFGYGFGFAFLVVGGATSPGGWAAETADWDLSIGSSVGKAETISRSSDDCPCTQR
jgi:RHS repeat-associated protein